MLWELNSTDLTMFLSFIFLCSFLCGWFADRIAGAAGFTTLGNWLLLFIGATLGIYVFNVLGYRFQWYPGMTLLVVLGAGLGFLLVMMGIKKIAHV